MKINEIIREDYDGSTKPVNNDNTPWQGLNPDHAAVQQGINKVRDSGGIDRVYYLNRMMMAMALHDGETPHKVDMPISSWAEKYNTAHPYTDQEHNMVLGALKTVPSDHKVALQRSKSMEPDDVYRESPVPKKKKNKYGI